MQNFSLNVIPATKTGVKTNRLLRSRRLWSLGLIFTAIVGAFCGITGLTMNVFFLLGLAENKGLMALLSIWLLVAAFPMLWITSHCLDRVDELDRQIRLERCGRSGIEANHTDDPPAVAR